MRGGVDWDFPKLQRLARPRVRTASETKGKSCTGTAEITGAAKAGNSPLIGRTGVGVIYCCLRHTHPTCCNSAAMSREGRWSHTVSPSRHRL